MMPRVPKKLDALLFADDQNIIVSIQTPSDFYLDLLELHAWVVSNKLTKNTVKTSDKFYSQY